MRSATVNLSLLAAVIALHGCGGGLLAPDSVVEDPGAEAFLDRVDKTCGKLAIGNQPLSYLLDVNGNDAYLIDESSKLYFGKVDQATFANDINGFYPTGANQAALDCIFAQLGGK
ncbi:hypothetical protein [uncultured Thiocystis sp.]|jgi:hypothetical protein|uniref:hypothetical protein n=1 Tax=uncultured Thiocystis sp. TaxID=1202134 RepID=UPI0025CF8707|nr:hypothetical protein [uncultured Thiocystis sp.]